MIYGDNPQKINEKQDALGLNTYTMIPQITAVMQAGNLYVYALGNPLAFSDPTGEIAITTLILIGAAVIALIAAGATAYNSYHYTGQIDWENTITTGLSWFMMAYTLGLSAYGVYLSYCDYKGITPVTEVRFNTNASIASGNRMIPQNLFDELSNSGAKYSPEDVVMVTKNPSGKLFWLEKGSSSAGLQHIVENHNADLLSKGITDIPSFLQKLLATNPISSGRTSAGPYADYLFNGSKYRLAYGDNGFIVSLYPIK